MPYCVNFFDYYDSSSYVGTFQKKKDKYINKSTSIQSLSKKVNNNTSPCFDLFFSINNIKPYKNRCTENVCALNWCFADLDIYHEDNQFSNLSKEQIYNLINEELCKNNKIPIPTIVIDSGRGLYLLWKINQSITYKKESKLALNRWKRVQKELNLRLIDFCADVKISTDCARLLRVPNSYNSKSKTKVEILRHNETNIYSLYKLEDFLFGVDASRQQINLLNDINVVLDKEIDSYSKHEARRQIKNNINNYLAKKYGFASKKQIDYCQAMADKLYILFEPEDVLYSYQANDFIKRFEELYKKECGTYEYIKKEKKNDYSNLYRKRLSMIESIIKSGDDYSGSRENMLFLYRYYSCCLLNDKIQALENTLKINQYFYKPLNDREVIRSTHSAEKYWVNGQVLKISKETFCEYINITKEKYNEFCYETGLFCDEKNKKESRKNINKKAYAKKVHAQNKALKKEEITQRQEIIYKYIKLGYTDKQIQEELHISRATYFRDKKIVLEKNACKKGKEMNSVAYIKEAIVSSICDTKNKIKKYIKYRTKRLKAKSKMAYKSLKNSYTLILYVLRTHPEILDNGPPIELILYQSG